MAGTLITKRGGAADLAAGAWNGTFHESFDAVVTSDGVTITMSLEQSGGGDLTMNFSDGDTTLDCTPAQTIALTAGTDTSPQTNYIYIPQATKVLTKSTSDWPAGEHIRVAFFFVQSATGVQTNGALVNQNWDNHFSGTDNQGHITHIGAWIRRAGASWFSGVNGVGSDQWIDIVGASSPDDVYFKSSSGEVSQMHLHSYPAKDSSAGDEIFIINHDTTPYTVATNLNTVLTDASGGSLNGRYFSFVFMGVANKSGEYGPLLLLLPTGSYNNSTDAINDVDKYDVYSPPREFTKDSSTGFHICRVTFQHSPAAGGTWTVVNTDDLRNPLGGIAGGGAGGGFSIGTQDQIPHVNAGGSDFDYSADITWDDERLDIVGATGTENINIGEAAGGAASSYAVNIGYQAGRTAVGDEHVAIGRNAGDASSGDGCVYVGAFAGQLATASQNTFIGHSAGNANLAGAANTFLGSNAGLSNTTASGNVFLGSDAGQGNATGQFNTFVGVFAGGFNNNTSESVALGYYAGEYAQGAGNISVGFEAFENAVLTPRTGTYGVALGYKAGESDATADYVISIGYQAGQSNALDNVVNIGQNAQATAANQFCVGTTYTTALLGTMQFDIDQVIGVGQDNYILTYDNGTGLISLEALDTTGDWTGTFDGQEGTYYLSRTNHTGTQLASTISDFTSASETAIFTALNFVDGTTVDFTVTAGDSVTAEVIAGAIDHDSLLNYVANEHIDHTSVTLTAGVGLTGGGDISANRTFTLAVDELSEKTGDLVGTDRLTGTSGVTNFSETINTIPLSIFNNDSGWIANVVEDTTPQLGGDLDLNGFNIDFPTTPNISDTLDDDTMATASATTLATSESIKAYVDSQVAAAGNTLDLAYDSGGAGAGRTIDADSGAVAITVSDTDNNTVLEVTQNDVTNNPDALVVTNAGTGAAISLAGAGSRVIDSDTGNLTISTTTSGTLTFSGVAAVVMDGTGVSGTLIKDEDTMVSDSATHLATQQSIKAYVDSQVATVDTFLELTDTPGSYTTANAIYTTNGTPNAVIETTVILTEGVNTFNITKGTAVLDIAAGSTLNVDANLTVESASFINQDVTSDAAPTFAGVTLTGDITTTGAAVDWDLIDNNASALSFDAAGKAGILELDTTDGTEGVKMSGYLNLGASTAVSSVLDEDDMASDSATALATQQSIKAYVDSNSGAFAELETNTTVTKNIIFSEFNQTTSGSGVFTERVSEFQLETNNGANGWSKMELQILAADSGNVAYTQEFNWTSNNFDWSTTIALGQTTNQDVFFGFAYQTFSGGAPANATLTGDHAAFMVDDGTLYASIADGTTQERTDVSSGITLTNYNNYRIIWTANTNAKFYINGTLVATLSTNLPDEALPPLLIYGIETNTAAYAGMKMTKNSVFQVDLP